MKKNLNVPANLLLPKDGYERMGDITIMRKKKS
jgi:hypothetical protein